MYFSYVLMEIFLVKLTRACYVFLHYIYKSVHVHIPISFVDDNYKSLSKHLASFWLHCILSTVVHLYPFFCTGHGVINPDKLFPPP